MNTIVYEPSVQKFYNVSAGHSMAVMLWYTTKHGFIWCSDHIGPEVRADKAWRVGAAPLL